MANRVDLAGRFLPVLERKGWSPKLLVFEPYNADAIMKILRARLKTIDLKKFRDTVLAKHGAARAHRATAAAKSLFKHFHTTDVHQRNLGATVKLPKKKRRQNDRALATRDLETFLEHAWAHKHAGADACAQVVHTI